MEHLLVVMFFIKLGKNAHMKRVKTLDKCVYSV